MKSPKVIVLGIEVLLLSLSASPALTRSSGQGQAAPALLSPEMLVEDFSVFRRALEESHPGAYRHTSQAEFDALFDGIATELGQPMSEQDFYRALNPAIVALRCGHTKLHPERNFATPCNYGLEEQLPPLIHSGN
jgi:hypothetical protein